MAHLPAQSRPRYRRYGLVPDPAILRTLLQRHQNASVTGQRRAGLSPGSADWNPQFTRDTRRTSSSLRQGLGFRYTQPGLDKQNLPPSAGMQFFGHVRIEGATGQMIVTLRDRADVALWSVMLDPKLG